MKIDIFLKFLRLCLLCSYTTGYIWSGMSFLAGHQPFFGSLAHVWSFFAVDRCLWEVMRALYCAVRWRKLPEMAKMLKSPKSQKMTPNSPQMIWNDQKLMIFGHIYTRKKSKNPQKHQGRPKLPSWGLKTHWCGCTIVKAAQNMKKGLLGGFNPPFFFILSYIYIWQNKKKKGGG